MSPRHRTILAFFLLLGALLRLWGIVQPNLHLWDERFHALVAKNIALHGWIPTFYWQPLFPVDPSNWQGNHVWLHKPPLGLWLGALSMKLFGVTEWAYRLPSLLMGTLAILLTFGIARRLFNLTVGLIAAALHAVSGHLLIFNTGTYGMDNVDNALFFFTELAVYLWVRGLQEGKRIIIMGAGVSVGLALLSKSYPALIAWGLFAALAAFPERRSRRHVLDAALMLAVALAVALPWRVYSRHRWPQEFAAAEKLQLSHFSESQLSGKKTEWTYHFKNIPRDYGEFAVPALLLLLGRALRRRTPALAVTAIWFAVPYALFSAAETKISTLVNYCAPAIFIAMALAAEWMWARWHAPETRRRQIWVALLALGLVLTLRVTGEKLIQIGTGLFAVPKSEPISVILQTRDPRTAVFHCPQYAEVMFYSELTAYPFLPSNEQVTRLLNENWTVAVVNGSDDGFRQWQTGLGPALAARIQWLQPPASEPRKTFWQRVRSL